MRKLGLVGGMSWCSTALYYQAINKEIAKRVGGLSSAPLLIESHDFAPMAELQKAGDWEGWGDMLAQSARRLQDAGAEGILLCSNTAHRVYGQVASAVEVPILHIGDVTAERLEKDGVIRAALLGTRFTMNESFYRERLEQKGITVKVPNAAMAAEIDRIIYEELARGHVARNSQRTLRSCLAELGKARVQAVILGCTELVMLVDPSAGGLPVYDTTALHSQAGVEWILGQREAGKRRKPTAAAA